MTGEWGAGRDFREAARASSRGHLATIIYTSGTTGEPEGRDADARESRVEHRGGLAGAARCPQDDVALSFLPLSHAFERMVSFIYLSDRRQIIFAESLETDCARHRGRAADGDDRGAARLREAAGADRDAGEAAPGSARRRSSAGR